jgi:hypothetical protein
VRVVTALRLVQGAAARKDKIGALQQLRLTQDELRWCAVERGELIHAVVHGYRRGRQVARQADCHRGVVPEDKVVDTLVVEESREQRPLHLVGVEPGNTLGQPRYHHAQAGDWMRDIEPAPRAARWQCDRLFDEEDAAVAGEPTKQVLWTLVNKVPSQMRQAHAI